MLKETNKIEKEYDQFADPKNHTQKDEHLGLKSDTQHAKPLVGEDEDEFLRRNLLVCKCILCVRLIPLKMNQIKYTVFHQRYRMYKPEKEILRFHDERIINNLTKKGK